MLSLLMAIVLWGPAAWSLDVGLKHAIAISWGLAAMDVRLSCMVNVASHTLRPSIRTWGLKTHPKYDSHPSFSILMLQL